ncbi:hypothetical protein [Streptomyces sp. enrichment culture]|uniref:hypothetical protein n=1 Tax=Streptomyces sp. enrichment culture TaxID=1795815 RepID=UPI003F55E9EF
MERRPHPLLSLLALAGIAVAAWAGWLGWDQTRDVHPDGSTTGPYEAWQIIGLVLTLSFPLYRAASRHHPAAAATGIPLGLTAAALYDWSDDASGLYMIGVILLLGGSLTTTTALTALITKLNGHNASAPSTRQS